MRKAQTSAALTTYYVRFEAVLTLSERASFCRVTVFLSLIDILQPPSPTVEMSKSIVRLELSIGRTESSSNRQSKRSYRVSTLVSCPPSTPELSLDMSACARRIGKDGYCTSRQRGRPSRRRTSTGGAAGTICQACRVGSFELDRQ